MSGSSSDRDPLEEFSLVQGGPLHRLYCRCGLMRLPVDLLGRRIVAIVLLVWLPPFLLSIMAGTLYGGVGVPFLHNLSTHARFLGALPLLFLAEVIVHERIAAVVRQFHAQALVLPEQRLQFEEIVRSTTRMAHSAFPEGILAVVAFTLGHWLWIQRVALPMETWFGQCGTDGTIELTTAGHWYAFVSLPVFRFIVYRWYYRLALWYRLLWKVSRLPLNLNPAHPDRCAGLGFLSLSVVAFTPLLVAHTLSASGLVGDQIWHRGMSLPQFKWELGLLVAILLLAATAPLLFFMPGLARARRAGLRRHGVFAARYVNEFSRKWILPEGPRPSPLGSQDIQSLADLGTSYDVLRETRIMPIGRRSLINVAIALVLPLLPLALTMMPLEEILSRFARFLL